jgi:hypothetical protein
LYDGLLGLNKGCFGIQCVWAIRGRCKSASREEGKGAMLEKTKTNKKRDEICQKYGIGG